MCTLVAANQSRGCDHSTGNIINNFPVTVQRESSGDWAYRGGTLGTGCDGLTTMLGARNQHKITLNATCN